MRYAAAQSKTDLATVLETRRLERGTARGALGDLTGLSYPSLQKILSGESDFKVSNLLAVAHALELDVALLPRGLGPAVAAHRAGAATGPP